MPDAQQAAYDAANRQIKQLEKQVEYYKHIAKIWQEVAGRLYVLGKNLLRRMQNDCAIL